MSDLFSRPGLVLLATLILMVPSQAMAEQSGLWAGLLAGDHVVLMRHAAAPGMGDPDDFVLGDCSTQRNLSAAGLAQAVRIGERLRANGIGRARVYSSQWCRCLDTARALGLGPVQPLPALNSFFRDFSREDMQTQATRQWIERRAPDGPLILVTHQVNITALTGIFPASGELVFIRLNAAGAVEPVGRIETQ